MSTLQLNEQGDPVGADHKGKASDKVRGEKQWQPNADTMEAYGDHSTQKANTRLPYASTLLGLEEQKEEAKKADAKAGAAAEAKWSGPVRGEKQWQPWAGDQEDYILDATNAANKRLPYHSTLQMNNLVQIKDDDEEEEEEQEQVEVSAAGEKFSSEKLPLDFHLVHISNGDDELIKIEDSKGIPLDFRFWMLNWVII